MERTKNTTNRISLVALALALFGATAAQAAAHEEDKEVARFAFGSHTWGQTDRPPSRQVSRSSSGSTSPETLGLNEKKIIRKIKDQSVAAETIIQEITKVVTDPTAFFDLSFSKENGATPLIIAAQYDPAKIEPFVTAIVQTLNSTTEHIKRRLNDYDDHGNTAMMHLVQNETLHDEEIAPLVKVLTDAGANPNQSNNKLLYPLHTAISLGKGATVNALLEAEASATIVDGNGFTSLNVAVAAGMCDLIELLIEHGAKKKDLHCPEPAFKAACDGKLNMVQMLIENYNFPFEQEDRHGTNILYAAAAGGSIEVIEYLFKQNTVQFGMQPVVATALTYAAGNDQLDMVKHLVDNYFASPLNEDANGTKAWQQAAKRNASNVCTYFLGGAPDPFSEEETATIGDPLPNEVIPEMLWHACANGATSVVEAILAARPDAVNWEFKMMSQVEYQEVTALQAARLAHPETASLVENHIIERKRQNVASSNCYECSPTMGLNIRRQRLRVFDCCGGTACIRHFNHLAAGADAQCPYCQSYDFGRPQE